MPEHFCYSCQTKMKYLGQLGLRTGGMEGGWEFLLGAWADVDERVIHLDTYRCETCGRLEFFDKDFSLPNS